MKNFKSVSSTTSYFSRLVHVIPLFKLSLNKIDSASTARKWIGKSILCAILSLMALCFASGCLDKSPDNSNLPWAKPASWEGGMPGLNPCDRPSY